MPSAFTVRLLGPNESGMLARVDDGVFDAPVQPDLAAAYLANRNNLLAAALEDGIVVGMASAIAYLHPDKPLQLFINEVGVATRARRRGVARALVHALLERGHAMGCKEAWVATEVDNVAARALYAAAGGTEEADHAAVYVWKLADASEHPSRIYRTAVIEAIHERRSIRAYRSQAVERNLLTELLWAAVQAPTPPVSGEAPWKVCAIEGAWRLSEYGARAKQFVRDRMRAGEGARWADRPDFEVFWNAPVAVVFCAAIGNPESPLDCCRAAQNFTLAAHSAGLGTCWVGAPLPWLRDADIAAEIGIPVGYEASAVVLAGYPAEQPRGEPRPQPEVIWC